MLLDHAVEVATGRPIPGGGAGGEWRGTGRRGERGAEGSRERGHGEENLYENGGFEYPTDVGRSTDGDPAAAIPLLDQVGALRWVCVEGVRGSGRVNNPG